jgi:hypothetical protein
MLSRHAEALADLDAAGVKASTLPQAELLSRILYQAAEPAQALARSAELSARFGRPEGLEALLIVMSPRAEELDPQTEAAVREAFETFTARFPNSKRIIQRELPDSEEGIRQLLAEMAPAGDRDREIVAGIRDGSTVTAVLAAVHGRSLSELWAALSILPLAYEEATLDDLELQDARRTLASPAVLDPTSLSVLALLGEEVAQAVLRALPGAQIPQASLQDADRGVNPMNDPRAPSGAVVRDPRSGEPVVIANDAEDAERRAARGASICASRKRFTLSPTRRQTASMSSNGRCWTGSRRWTPRFARGRRRWPPSTKPGPQRSAGASRRSTRSASPASARRRNTNASHAGNQSSSTYPQPTTPHSPTQPHASPRPIPVPTRTAPGLQLTRDRAFRLRSLVGSPTSGRERRLETLGGHTHG